MYYVRKLSKPSSLYKLKTLDDVKNLSADFLGQDLRTTENTLSVWRSETLEAGDLNQAINAALLASSQVNASQFLVIDSEALANVGIRTDDSQPGKTAYIGLEPLHTNLCDLTYEKIGQLLQIYCDICNDMQRTPKIEKARFKEIIIEADNQGKLNMAILSDHMKKEIQKVLSST